MKSAFTLTTKSLFFCIVFFVSASSFAQWNGDTAYGGTMLQRRANLNYNKVISDSAGGAFTFFVDSRSIPSPSSALIAIRAQHCDSSGKLLWNSVDSGKVLLNKRGAAVVAVTEDGTGGAYLLYRYNHPSTIFPGDFEERFVLNRMNANGQLMWPDSLGFIDQYSEDFDVNDFIVRPTLGGVIVSWSKTEYEGSNQKFSHYYANKLLASGQPAWGSKVLIYTNPHHPYSSFFAETDGNGGLFVLSTILTELGDSEPKSAIYAQHINASGMRQLTDTGKILRPFDGINYLSYGLEGRLRAPVPDGAGGFYFVYYNASDFGVDEFYYVQRVNLEGVLQWPGKGCFIGTFANSASLYLLGQDFLARPGGGITILTLMEDLSVMQSAELMMQQVSATGVAKFVGNLGKKIADCGRGFQDIFYSAGVHKPNGNLSVAYSQPETNESLLLQTVDTAGNLLHSGNGKTIIRQGPSNLWMLNGTGSNVLLHWGDSRNHGWGVANFVKDIFLTRIDGNDNLPLARRTIFSQADGNWNNTSTWAGGVVPGPQDIVVVTNAVVVNSSAICYSLTVRPPDGGVTVMAGQNLTVLH